MLPILYRLPKKEFRLTMRRGIRMQIDAIQFSSLANELPYSRLGMLITKKFSKKAAERNRIKRQFLMAFLPYMEKGFVSADIVCTIRQPMPESTYNDTQKTVEKFFAKHP